MNSLHLVVDSMLLNRFKVSVDVDDRRSILKSPRIPFGIIGAGSANSIVMTVHDTDDYATSAVHIAIGM